MPGGKIWGGIDWVWDGEILKPTFGGGGGYRVSGSRIEAVFGGNRWSWSGSRLELQGGDSRQSVWLEGSRIEPYNRSSKYTWEYWGRSLSCNAQGKSYTVDGDIPMEAIAVLVADVLNKDVDWDDEPAPEPESEESEPEEGVKHLKLKNCLREVTDWSKVPVERKVSMPFGCSKDCQWDDIKSCPSELRSCDVCKGDFEKGEPHLFLHCEHSACEKDICNRCSEILQKRHQLKGHVHEMILLEEPVTAWTTRGRIRCDHCGGRDEHGAWCPTCKAYFCTPCANSKSTGSADCGCTMM